MRWQALDKIDTSLYKGMAILLIVSHNFMHLFPAPRENEFGFYLDRTFNFLQLTYTEPENILRISLSFFGHFGVQIFVFLSAYGLSVKYLQRKPDYWRFLWQRMLKIYPAFLLAILAWITIEGWIIGGYGLFGPLKILYWNIGPLLLKVSLLSNFLPELSLQPVGPWWFIPFIFQFYVIFPLLRHLNQRFGAPGLLMLSTASIMLAILTGGKIGGLNIYFTVLGHLPVFCIGIYLANQRHREVTIPKLVVFGAIAFFVLGNFYETFWHGSHVAFFILLLVGFNFLAKCIGKTKTTQRLIAFYGGISMQLFLVNGFLREPFISWAMTHNHWLLTIVLCFISIFTSTLVALALAIGTRRLMSNINGDTPASLFTDINKNLKQVLSQA